LQPPAGTTEVSVRADEPHSDPLGSALGAGIQRPMQANAEARIDVLAASAELEFRLLQDYAAHQLASSCSAKSEPA
jgi:hypothetical protein